MRSASGRDGNALRFVPYESLGETPNVIVDGAPQEATVLTLSHWPGSGTPLPLKADTSTESCYRFLSAPEVTPEAEEARAVSNNHLDVDGLLGMWVLLNPDVAWDHLEDVIAAATADDFGRVTTDRGARVALALAAQMDLGYIGLLPRVAHVLRHLPEYEPLYREAWARYSSARDHLQSGRATLEEHPDVDLAIVRSHEPLHEWAENSATERLRVVEIVDGRVMGLRYRYESWVQFISRSVMPRVDLQPLLDSLDRLEGRSGARWEFDGIADIVPRLQLVTPGGDPVPSRIAPERFVATVAEYLRENQGRADLTWNPFDP